MKFPLSFYRANPNEFAVKYVSGKRRKGARGAFYLVGPRTTIALVPTSDQSTAYQFTELTSDGQQVNVQGELVVKFLVEEILDRRDFTIDPKNGSYLDEAPDSVKEDASHALQTFVRSIVATFDLKTALAATAEIERQLLVAIRGTTAFADLGVEVKMIFVTSVAPANLDLKKALEAEAREKMLADADKAIADRRKKAAVTDRSLKEYEADTAQQLEARRAALVAARNANVIAEAQADAHANVMRLTPYEKVDPRILLALGLRELASGGRVQNLSITPDLLLAVTNSAKSGSGS